MNDVTSTRSSGLLLHPTSLPGTEGIGTLGTEATAFLDSLHRCGQRWWQMLPVGPTGYGNSPYQSHSTFAGSPLLVDTESLVSEGLLSEMPTSETPPGAVDYGAVIGHKMELLARAAERFPTHPDMADEFDQFRRDNRWWLDDYALYVAVKEAHGDRAWLDWDSEIRDRAHDALSAARRLLTDVIRRVEVTQFLFHRQWLRLRGEAADRGIGLIGDLPIFVAHDSADVWAHRDLFDLDETGHPVNVAGVPPDYFSATGQRWGNPLYLWDRHRSDGFEWWTKRLGHVLDRFDLVRIDHFRGFVAYWEIPGEEETAVGGHWVEGPGASFFRIIEEHFGDLPIVAEDLGIITPDVTRLRRSFGFPGMRVVQFGFDEEESDTNLHHPKRYPGDVVAYTGTHDNDTAMGWFWRDNPTRDPDLLNEGRRQLLEIGDVGDVHWTMISLAAGSDAHLAVYPVQDLLGLDSTARMNIPATTEGNWTWRMSEPLSEEVLERLDEVTRETGRT